MKSRLLLPLFALLLSLSLVGPLGQSARAQSDEIDTESLLNVPLEAGALPIAPAFMRLVRITLDPGATSPAHTHPGPELGWVESGVVTVTVKGPASIKQRSSKAKDPFEAIKADDPTTLDKGDQVLYPTGTTISFTNKGTDPADVLALVILPAAADHPDLIDYTDGAPSDDTFTGVASEVLGDAIMTTLPTGPAQVTIDRISLKAGQSLPGSRNPVLFSVESGDCQFTVTDGSVQISRKRDPGPQTDVAYDENIKLRSGDAMFFPNGLRTTSRGEASEELDLLRVVVAPTSSDEKLSEASRGSIKFKEPVAKEDDTSDQGTGDTPTGFAAGAMVYVNSTDVNLRDSPSLNGGQVTVLLYGQQVTIDGDSVDADGVTWWPVHVTDDASLAGYVSAEFLQTDPVQ